MGSSFIFSLLLTFWGNLPLFLLFVQPMTKPSITVVRHLINMAIFFSIGRMSFQALILGKGDPLFTLRFPSASRRGGGSRPSMCTVHTEFINHSCAGIALLVPMGRQKGHPACRNDANPILHNFFYFTFYIFFPKQIKKINNLF